MQNEEKEQERVTGGRPRRLFNRAALVTGGGRGIGRAIALAFACEGAAVAVAARTVPEIEAVAEECRGLGARAMALPLDVSDSASCEQAVASCEAEWGQLDILVNNAGFTSAHRFPTIDNETWHKTLTVDLTGAFYMTRAALPGMLDRADGTVISMSSIAGKIGARYYAAYTAAKHGLIGLMRALAAEYPRSGVTFNSVCPGFTDSPMTDHAIATVMEKTGRSHEEVLRALVTPQGRLVRPDEIAAVCVLLASPEGRGINGQAINVDGGQVQS
jgi:NAD(P)-dependent dehydrogenase (short-subunit alcohol dehydrogenase family)